MTANNRPLSPHLQVYRLPLTGLLSIAHRITGVALSAGLLLVVYLLYAIAAGEEAYAAMQALMGLWPAKVVYWGFVYALFFHFCHGIRHLIWDTGKSFERATMNRHAGFELLASLTLTLMTFLFL